MSAKLGMSLDDIVAKEAPKKGGGKGGAKGGGKGGAMKRMGAGRGARAAAAPYQKPVRPGKGGKGQMAAAEEPAAQAQPTFTLTTGTTVRVANLAYNVTRYIICRIRTRSTKYLISCLRRAQPCSPCGAVHAPVAARGDSPPQPRLAHSRPLPPACLPLCLAARTSKNFSARSALSSRSRCRPIRMAAQSVWRSSSSSAKRTPRRPSRSTMASHSTGGL